MTFYEYAVNNIDTKTDAIPADKAIATRKRVATEIMADLVAGKKMKRWQQDFINSYPELLEGELAG